MDRLLQLSQWREGDLRRTTCNITTFHGTLTTIETIAYTYKYPWKAIVFCQLGVPILHSQYSHSLPTEPKYLSVLTTQKTFAFRTTTISPHVVSVTYVSHHSLSIEILPACRLLHWIRPLNQDHNVTQRVKCCLLTRYLNTSSLRSYSDFGRCETWYQSREAFWDIPPYWPTTLFWMLDSRYTIQWSKIHSTGSLSLSKNVMQQTG